MTPCVTANAECNLTTARCECSQGYSEHEGECIQGKRPRVILVIVIYMIVYRSIFETNI